MSEIRLNIGKPGNFVKTYTAEGYDLMLGTLEDFIAIMDIDKMSDNNEVVKMIMAGYSKLKPLLKDIFPELTDDDYRNIAVSELVATITQVGMAVVEKLQILTPGNPTRA